MITQVLSNVSLLGNVEILLIYLWNQKNTLKNHVTSTRVMLENVLEVQHVRKCFRIIIRGLE